MNDAIARFGLLLLLVLSPPLLVAAPKVVGDVSGPECRDAALLAGSMFRSNAIRLYAPLVIPDGMRSTMVLGAEDTDISGGDALYATDEFERLIWNLRSVYWAKDPDAGKRLVVAERSLGWRGDMYFLYQLDETIDSSTFLNAMKSETAERSFEAIIAQSWRPPLVFSLPDNGGKWFIDVGQPFEVLSDWRVYKAGASEPACTMVFRDPPNNPHGRLPVAVRKLAGQLDEALGPGMDEGTLQPTANIRGKTQHILASAALRPWALSWSDAYNSREEVEAGLEAWAEINNSRARLRSEIGRTYPEAQHALATYYVKNFKLSPRQADEVSAWVTDLLFRSYFVFPGGAASDAANPWPLK